MRNSWSSPACPPLLRDGAAQVWRLQLGEPGLEPLLARAHATLSDDERERAGRMRAGLPRDEFMAGRGLLRLLLGAASGVAPGDLQIQAGRQGKPALVEPCGLDFNTTHSRGCLLLTISRAGAVGVDVESLDRNVEALELAQQHFHPAELALLQAEKDEARRSALFFRCWTRKEAVLKADGRGLQVGLEQLCVLPDTAAVQNEGPEPVALPDGSTFWVRDLQTGAGLAAALAIPKRDTPVDYLNLTAWN